MFASLGKFSVKDESCKNEKHADGIENREKINKLVHANDGKILENLLL